MSAFHRDQKGGVPPNKLESKYFNTAEKMDAAFLELLERKDLPYITVKELCQKAGVNRSTFYLHYETIDDLLSESVDYLNRHFLAHMQQETASEFCARLRTCPIEELNLITPEYLMPYLSYLQAHQRLFRTALEHAAVLRLHDTYDHLFHHVLSPILDRFQIPEENRAYLMAFYLQGIMGLLGEWLNSGCSTPASRIAALIQQCIFPAKTQQRDAAV